MNEMLTKMIEKRDMSRVIPKKQTFEDKPVDERLRTYDLELQNQQKTISLLVDEHNALKHRLEQLRNHDYWLDLDEKITEIRHKIDQIRKENKQLDWQMQQLGKNITNVEINTGTPEEVKVYNERLRALNALNKKNEKLQGEVDNFARQKTNQSKRIDELNKKIMNLESLAEQQNVDIGKNPLKPKFTALVKEIKAQEEGIKILLNRNEKYAEIYLDTNLEELNQSLQRDRGHILKLERMIHTQVSAIRELIAKESPNVDKSVRELFDKFQVPLESYKPSLAEGNKPMSEKELQAELDSKRSLKVKGVVDRDDIYKDLPLFTPKREDNKSLVKKSGNLTKSIGRKRNRSSEEEGKNTEDYYDLYLKDVEKPTTQLQKGQEAKQRASSLDKSKHQPEKNEEIKPEQSKEDTKSAFSKPFGFKKGGEGTKFGMSPEPKDKRQEPEFDFDEQSDNMRSLLDKYKAAGPVENKKQEKKSEVDIQQNNDFSRLNYQGQPNRLPDEVVKNKQEQSIKLNNESSSQNDHLIGIGGIGGQFAGAVGRKNFVEKTPEKITPKEEPLKLHNESSSQNDHLIGIGGIGGQFAGAVGRKNFVEKTPEKITPKEEPLKLNNEGNSKNEILPIGTAGLDGMFAGAAGRKDLFQQSPEKREEPVYNIGNSSKMQAKSEFDDIFDNKTTTLEKKTQNPLTFETKDPFSKQEGPSRMDLSKKDLSEIGSKLNYEANTEKKEEPKPFTLNSQQPGPKRMLNPDPFAQQTQPLTLSNQQQLQPLNLNQNRQPQLRLNENPTNQIWGKKSDESEIKTIGEDNSKVKGLEDYSLAESKNISQVKKPEAKKEGLSFLNDDVDAAENKEFDSPGAGVVKKKKKATKKPVEGIEGVEQEGNQDPGSGEKRVKKVKKKENMLAEGVEQIEGGELELGQSTEKKKKKRTKPKEGDAAIGDDSLNLEQSQTKPKRTKPKADPTAIDDGLTQSSEKKPRRIKQKEDSAGNNDSPTLEQSQQKPKKSKMGQSEEKV